MPWIEFKNLQPLPLKDIPVLPVDRFRSLAIESAKAGRRVVQYFGKSEPDGTTLYCLLADDERSRLYAIATRFRDERAYPSITPEVPAFHLFEREFYEQFRIRPEGHPWLKPVRGRTVPGPGKDGSSYPFFRMEGDEIHEVGVGPVHAGIIEPGYFRFSAQGEDVHHLEIRLGFQHRGLEELFCRRRGHPVFLLNLAESIAGDSVLGHAGAYAAAMEALGGTDIGLRAMSIRTIALEWERVANHLGDLAALAGDTAYLTGSAAFGALRTKAVNTTLAICGSRFGRGLVAIGGVHQDIDGALRDRIRKTVDGLEADVQAAGAVLFASSSVLARFEKAGIVYPETARRIGMVGPPARACGLALDVRSDHPFGGYAYLPVHTITLESGDVFARAYIRYAEIEQSLRIIREQLDVLEGGGLSIHQPAEPKAGMMVVSMAEGWRGEIAHIAITGPEGKLERYKIKDPSFHNWLGLALAVRKNGISDFPLCNKSFNLSYCGFDL
ncbi:MAG: hydrogenase large subunit [Candidatus Aminicenantales bacterium]